MLPEPGVLAMVPAMMETLQNLLSKADLLIVFVGMAVLLWRSMGALQSSNSENISLTQMLAQLMAGQPTKQPPSPPQPLPLPVPAKPPPPPPPPPVSTQPVDVVDQGLVNFIKKTEGLSLKAYWDYKQYSIGYGTKANSATEVITEPEALARLTVEIDKAEKLAEKVIPAGAPIGVKQALTDLTYNAGSGWEEAGLGTAVKASDWVAAKEHLLQYNHAGGVVNAGLTARREAEASWFDSPL